MNLFNKIFLGILLAFFLNDSSCEKSNESIGTVKDFTGLDGCKILIVLEDGTRLEPQVLPQGATLIVDRKVAVKYKQLTDRMSICMTGPIVEITSLRYL
jgi:hypothetical protein